MRNERGLSLVETMIVSTLMLFVLLTAFSLIIHFGNAQKTELARTRVSEESRFIFNSFSDQLKDAGSILTMINSSSFLGDLPYFNGIYPLDSANGPDGVIVASGDPDGVTALTDDFKGGTTLKVETTLRTKDNTPAWRAGDQGIVISKEGYYVFSVAAVSLTQLTLRAEPVYYSGLLKECGTYKYTDALQPAAVGNKGNAVTYSGVSAAPNKTPVIRLTNFSIYLFNEIEDKRLDRKVNRLYRLTDTTGSSTPNLLASTEVVSDSIYDMQLSYAFFPDLPDTTTKYTFYGAGASGAPAGETVHTAIQKKFLKEIEASIVVLTDEYGGRRANLPELKVPALKNRSAYTLPEGKYKFKIFSFQARNMNYNTAI